MCQCPWSHSHKLHPFIDLRLLLFILGTLAIMHWNSSNLPHGSFIHIYYYSRTMFSVLDDHDLKLAYMKLRVSHECI
jgi:hypothetical protein